MKHLKIKDQMSMFRYIWYEREHKSELSGIWLNEFNICCFAHILPKGMYPKFKLNPNNIMLLTPLEHRLIDAGTQEQRRTFEKTNNMKFDLFYEKKEKLSKEYKKL